MDTPSLQTLYDNQYHYVMSGQARQEGSPAIALGRAAGLAQLTGNTVSAQQLWDQTFPPATLPSFSDFYRGYLAHPDAFGEFADPHNFPLPGSAFSNACGSYAFAHNYLTLGNRAFEVHTPNGVELRGDPVFTREWGGKALRAAGFPQQAEILEKAGLHQTRLTQRDAENSAGIDTPRGR